MPDETPKFSSISLGDKPKKRRAARRRTTSIETTRSFGKKEITKNLTSIYSDGGKIPDMRHIKMRRGRPLLKYLCAFIIIGGLLAAAAWSGFFILPGKDRVSASKVELKITGAETLSLGSETTYNISYENKENFRLNNAILTIKYPESFSFSGSSIAADNAGHTEWNIGAILPHQKGNITITGKNYGAMDQAGSWRVFLNYKPENFNSELQKVATFNTKIIQSPFSIAISGPDKATVGNDAKYTFTLVNSGDWWPDKLEVTPIWPNNFYPTSSTPALDKNSKWIITASGIKKMSSSAPVGALNYIVSGKWGDGGVDDAAAPIKTALILPYNGQQYKVAEAAINTELIKNPVSFNLAINGSLKEIYSQPGDMLNITVGIKNTSPDELNKAVVKLTLTAPSVKKQSALQWPDIVDKYDANVEGKQISNTVRQGQMTWNSGKIAELARIKPGQELNIDIQLPVKDIKSFAWEDVDDYKISAAAEISYVDSVGVKQTVASNPLSIILNSDLKFEARDAASEDGVTHEINWILTNNFHPIKNIQLTADVFGDVFFEEPKEVPAGKFQYDQATKKISWTIPEMPESVDVLVLPFTISLNIKNPTQNTLVSKVRVQAEDAVTGNNLDMMGDEVLLK